MADVRLPSTLAPLFPGLPRQLDVNAATVGDVIDHLEREWPGIRDRLCEPGPTLRHHIHVYVNSERAKIDTPLTEQSRVDVIAAISGGSPLWVGLA
jgi:sulfur-carrier protein